MLALFKMAPWAKATVGFVCVFATIALLWGAWGIWASFRDDGNVYDESLDDWWEEDDNHGR